MANTEILKSNIIDTIMQMDSELHLSEIHDFINEKNTLNNDVNGTSIETITVECGVSLEEIEKRQTINKMTFKEVEKMFEVEEWEQTLEELMESID